MKYRVVKKGKDNYRVQYRANWWPFWITDLRYVLCIKISNGYHSQHFNTLTAAKMRIRELKAQARKRRIPAPKPEVVHTE